MDKSRESTVTIIKRHVEEEMRVYKKDIEESTCRLVSQCTDQIEHIKKVQDEHQATLFGKMPPDPADPGVYRLNQDNTQFISRLKSLGWKFLLGAAGAAGVAAWALL